MDIPIIICSVALRATMNSEPYVAVSGTDRNNADRVKIARDGIEPPYQYLLVELIFTLQLTSVRDLTCTSTYYFVLVHPIIHNIFELCTSITSTNSRTPYVSVHAI
jgi:hypothetical protein